MKEKIGLLNNVQFSQGRGKGNTTRQIDKAIQILYDGCIVEVRDHWEHGRHRRANENLFTRILDRLNSEHRSPGIKIDRKKLEIELLNL